MRHAATDNRSDAVTTATTSPRPLGPPPGRQTGTGWVLALGVGRTAVITGSADSGSVAGGEAKKFLVRADSQRQRENGPNDRETHDYLTFIDI